MRRNLFFYLYPVRGSVWDWHVEQLRRFREVFNGRRLVVVATDARTVPIAEVRRKLRGLGAEIEVVANDPARGESRHFLGALARLRSTRDDELTFYAHGKGVTHSGLKSLLMQSWSDAMYELNLSKPSAVEKLLKDRAAAGCFRQVMRHAGSSWHFSGTFFWFKHSSIFTRDWEKISRGRYGVEAWLGRHLPVEESVSLTPFRRFDELYRTPVTGEERRRWLAALGSAS